MSTALLARSSAPDRAFERLYRRHVHEVYRYVLAVLRNPPDAEDATQATFLSAYRAFIRGEQPLKPRNWLLKIAHNECRQRFRASARRPKEVQWDERAAAPGVDETVPTADEIRTALTQLSFNQRSALVMRELEGRSYAEIGAILDLSLSAVETLLFRARRALREQLEGTLTCGEAEATLSKRLDGRLAATEQRALRAHLRECAECAALERRQRARRTAVKGLGAVQLPPSLAGFLGGTSSVTGGAIAGSSLVAKAAAVVAAGAVAGGVGHEAIQAIAAGKPTRTPLPELRELPRGYATPLGALQAPGTPAEGIRAGRSPTGAPATSTTTPGVRDGVQALEPPSTETGARSDQVIALPPSVVSPTAPAAGSPGAPPPARPVVETAETVVEQVPALLDPVGEILPPPPPLPLPIEPPPLPLPPPPPLPLLPPPPPLPLPPPPPLPLLPPPPPLPLPPPPPPPSP
jgi:RNA polymerase sigma factor (sigma-70 family)